MRENRWRWFGHVQRNNNCDIIKEMGDIRVEENRERGGSKKNRMRVIGEDMRTRGADEDTVSDIDRGKIQVVCLTCVG